MFLIQSILTQFSYNSEIDVLVIIQLTSSSKFQYSIGSFIVYIACSIFEIRGKRDESRGTPDRSPTVSSSAATLALDKQAYPGGDNMYYCIIYLSPGDNHHFYSPTEWKICNRKHFPGKLLTVKSFKNLYVNERVVYTGKWKYGYFSQTAIGSTNVGSIKCYFDQDLHTNLNKEYSLKSFNNIIKSKGEDFGEFNFGSTIVLIFEAPEDFKFNKNQNNKILYGSSL